MAAIFAVPNSPEGSTLNGVHDHPSSAELSPSSSRISSDSPTVAPILAFPAGSPSNGTKVSDYGRSRTGAHSSRGLSADGDVADFGIVPKIEELDDYSVTSEMTMDDIMEDYDVKPDLSVLDSMSPMSPSAPSPLAVSRRPRGRPRKHPKPEPASLSKKPLGRSKTGCITCRRRKKKCDERKPNCMHCEKNNVQCEGYQPRDVWQSGRQKALARTQRRWSSVGPAPLPNLMPGVENDIDWLFFEHFNLKLSNLLSVHPEINNPFREQLLPMAQTHRGLMHSLLSLSGAHLLRQKDPAVNERLEDRYVFHLDKALGILRSGVDADQHMEGGSSSSLDTPTVAQVVVLCLQTICEGNVTGDHYGHLQALRSMLADKKLSSATSKDLSFMHEFLLFHDMSNSMTSRRGTLVLDGDFHIPTFISEGATSFLGALDGLYMTTHKTRQLRDQVRKRREEEKKPYVDYAIVKDGREIDEDLRKATCNHEPGSDDWLAWNLYRSVFWLYLHRTVNISAPSAELNEGVSEALEFLQDISPTASVQSVLLTPVFMLACAAFNADHRPAIEAAFDTLENFSQLGNIQPARQVVSRVWHFMDAGNDQSWDWEGIMEDMNMSFLVT